MWAMRIKYSTLLVMLFVTAAGAKVFVSEVFYIPDGEGPPAFIELYNSSESNVDMANWEIGIYKLREFTVQLPTGSIIPAYGFFLIGFSVDEEAWLDFSYTPDYFADIKFEGDSPGGIVVYGVSGETSDALGWGIVPEGYYEGEAFIFVSNGHSIERKSGENHNELRGNSYDTGNNLNDCYERVNPQPQNIHSPREQPSLNAEEQSIGYIKAMYDYQQ
jgi:hypothetical protein